MRTPTPWKVHVLTGYTPAKLKLLSLANAEELITEQMHDNSFPAEICKHLSFPLFATVFVQTVIQRDIALVIIAIAI